MAAPPALEFQETGRLGVDVRVDVVELRPIGIGRIHLLEVVDQVGAVEGSIPAVAGKRREPCPAEQAARVAHRVLAGHAGPVGHRRAREQQRPGHLGRGGGKDQRSPSALAVADQERLVFGVGVPLRHAFEKGDLRARDRFDRLARFRVRKEEDEIARMSLLQCDADLAVHLETADARPMTGARIDDDERSFLRIGLGRSVRRDDARQCIICRLGQRPAVHDDFVLERQNRRLAGPRMIEIDVAALTQHVQQQYAALPGIDPVFDRVLRALNRGWYRVVDIGHAATPG